MHKKLHYDFELPMKNLYDDIVDDYNKLDLATMSDDELQEELSRVTKIKRMMGILQIAVKVSMNSIYGASGTNIFPYFSQQCASDTCAEGRYYCILMDKVANSYLKDKWPVDTEFHELLWAQPFAEKLGFVGDVPKAIHEDVGVYGDTDSVYIEFGYMFKSLGLDLETINQKAASEFIVFFSEHKFDPIFNATLEKSLIGRNAENTMGFDLEMIGNAGIFVAKKKYIIPTIWSDGVYIAERGKLKSKGIELIQNSSSSYVKQIIKKFINLIFNDATLDERKFAKLTHAVVLHAETQPTRKLCKFGKVHKFSVKIIEWKDRVRLEKGTGGAVLGGATYNHTIYKLKLWNTYPYIRDGDRIFWYYDINNKPFAFPEDVEMHDWMPKMNKKMQIEKLIFGPVRRIASGKFKANMKKMGTTSAQFSFNVKRK